MGLKNSLWGGSEEVDTLTGPQQKLLNTINRRVLDEFGRPAETYQGQTTVPRTAGMTQGMSGAMSASQQNPMIQQAMNQALSGAGDPAAVRGMYEEALQPAQLEFSRALNEVSSRYGDRWGSAGAMPEMMGRTTAEYGMGLNKLLGEMTYNDRNAARERQLGAIAPSAGAQGQQMQNQMSLYGLGEAERGVDMQGAQADYSQWMASQWYNNPALGFIQPALGTQAFGIGEQQGIIPGVVNLAQGVKGLGSSGILGSGQTK